MIHKACPVVLHPDGAPLRHLQVRHPETGLHLITATAQTEGGNPVQTVAQDLFAKTGLETTAALPLGQSEDIVTAERWSFVLCRIKPPVRAEWVHISPNDIENRIHGSWFDIDTPDPELPAPYARALEWMRLNAL